MKKIAVAIIIGLLMAGVAFSKVGFDLNMGLGSGGATVGGPVAGSDGLLLEGDAQAGGDVLLLEVGTDKLLLE